MLTDIDGIRVGHATDARAMTGCTIAVFDEPIVPGVDVRGANAATIYTDLLYPDSVMPSVTGIMLTGGSAFGLEAALGAVRYFEEQGRGYDVGVAKIPLVPAAVIYDLSVGDPNVRPDLAMGRAACEAAKPGPFERGRVGGGTGATVGKLYGVKQSSPGGLGTATVSLYGGIKVSAMIVVNSFGDVRDTSGRIVAGAKYEGGEFADTYARMKLGDKNQSALARMGMNTTIGIVSTNCRLTKVEASRMATLAHNGLARAICPIHTNVDGDTLFATGLQKSELTAPVDLLGTAAAEAAMLACLDAVMQ
jgi:L-aminopeptidase/D-esterase-like protein